MPRDTDGDLKRAFELAEARGGLEALKKAWQEMKEPTSWGNCQRQYKKYHVKPKEPPTTPAHAAQAGSNGSKRDGSRSGSQIRSRSRSRT